MAEEKSNITWQAPEFIHYPKSKIWFVALGAVGVGLIIYFLLQKDILTSLMFFLLFAMFLYLARAKPRAITVVLSGRGLKLNESTTPFSQITSFWIVYDPPEVKTLNFETTAYLNRFLTIQLDDQDPVAIREFLLKFIPEDTDREERLSEQISRTLKF